MKTNRNLSVNEHNLNRLFETGSCFARSCFAAIVLVLVFFAGPISACKAAKPNELKVFFPQSPLPASRDDIYKTMMALAEGRLVLKNGCLRLKPNYIKKSFLLIWPGWYGLEAKDRNIKIKDVYAGLLPEVRIKLNSEVIVGGGAAPSGYVPDTSTLVQPLPKGCEGPYWFVGSVEPVPKGKKRHQR